MSVAILAALMLSAQPGRFDTVVLSDGGVLRGIVVEDVPGADLVLLMPDGTSRKIPRGHIVRVELAETPTQPAPPAGPAQPVEPQAPPAEPKAPAERGPLELGVWIGGALPTGTLDQSGLSLSSAFTPQFVLGFEASLRAADPLQLGLYLRFGSGAPHSAIRASCIATGQRCDAFSVGVGFFPRWSFAPRGRWNPWIQIGGGFESLSASNDYAGIDYKGWEVGAWAGVDLTGTDAALAFFAGVRRGEFTSGEVYGGLPMSWGGSAAHGWVEIGVRSEWWP